jgi:hypothetical protein
VTQIHFSQLGKKRQFRRLTELILLIHLLAASFKIFATPSFTTTKIIYDKQFSAKRRHFSGASASQLASSRD